MRRLLRRASSRRCSPSMPRMPLAGRPVSARAARSCFTRWFSRLVMRDEDTGIEKDFTLAGVGLCELPMRTIVHGPVRL